MAPVATPASVVLCGFWVVSLQFIDARSDTLIQYEVEKARRAR